MVQSARSLAKTRQQQSSHAHTTAGDDVIFIYTVYIVHVYVRNIRIHLHAWTYINDSIYTCTCESIQNTQCTYVHVHVYTVVLCFS